MKKSMGALDLPATALVTARDPAVGAAVALMLQAYGVDATVVELAAARSILTLAPTAALIVDRDLLLPDVNESLASLRRGGWRVLAVLMSEDAAGVIDDFSDAQRVLLLEKPFAGADLISRLTRGSADQAR